MWFFSKFQRYKTDRNKYIQELIVIDKLLNKNGVCDSSNFKLDELKLRKTQLINDIIEYRNFSKEINDIFENEIETYQKKSKNLWNYFCLKS